MKPVTCNCVLTEFVFDFKPQVFFIVGGVFNDFTLQDRNLSNVNENPSVSDVTLLPVPDVADYLKQHNICGTFR